ncbi:unnamed protein product [Rhizopus microsporus]
MFLISGTRHIAVIGLGEKEKPKNDLGGKSGQIREVQKTSKKINCPATMKANCYKSKPEERRADPPPPPPPSPSPPPPPPPLPPDARTSYYTSKCKLTLYKQVELVATYTRNLGDVQRRLRQLNRDLPLAQELQDELLGLQQTFNDINVAQGGLQDHPRQNKSFDGSINIIAAKL